MSHNEHPTSKDGGLLSLTPVVIRNDCGQILVESAKHSLCKRCYKRFQWEHIGNYKAVPCHSDNAAVWWKTEEPFSHCEVSSKQRKLMKNS